MRYDKDIEDAFISISDQEAHRRKRKNITLRNYAGSFTMIYALCLFTQLEISGTKNRRFFDSSYNKNKKVNMY